MYRSKIHLCERCNNHILPVPGLSDTKNDDSNTKLTQSIAFPSPSNRPERRLCHVLHVPRPRRLARGPRPSH